MKTAVQIQIDFDRTMQCADDLSTLARKLDALAGQKMENTLRTVARSWTGEASLQYQGKGRELEGKIRNSSAQLEKIAETLRTSARMTYRAEQEALRLARSGEV